MPPIVLTFAASDPTGGAGLQADLLTLAALGCHPLSVLTGLTVQDTSGVEQPGSDRGRSGHAPGARAAGGDAGSRRSRSACSARPRTCARWRRSPPAHADSPLVVDPVLASGAAMRWRATRCCTALLEALVPLRHASHAEHAGGGAARRRAAAARARAARYVLVTGTHDDSAEVINRLYDASGLVREDRWPRLPGSYHGSGCTLASGRRRRASPQGRAHARRGARGAGIHLAGARRGLPHRRRPAVPNRFFRQ